MDGDETPGQAAVRETAEEIRGISADPAGILGEHTWECPERCGWSYRTYVVRVPAHSSGQLPRVRVATGAHAWETSELAWVPAEQVTAGRQLHPAFADAWPALRERIDASARAGTTGEQVSRDRLPACSPRHMDGAGGWVTRATAGRRKASGTSATGQGASPRISCRPSPSAPCSLPS